MDFGPANASLLLNGRNIKAEDHKKSLLVLSPQLHLTLTLHRGKILGGSTIVPEDMIKEDDGASKAAPARQTS